MLLSFGMLMLLVYQIIAQQVAWVHDDANEAFRLFANPVDTVMHAWLFIVTIVCAVLQTRKGYVDTNRFRQTEHIPVGYFPLISGITGIASTLAIAAMRFIAEIQLVPIDVVHLERGPIQIGSAVELRNERFRRYSVRKDRPQCPLEQK